MRFEDSVDIAMWVGLAVFGLVIVYGFVRWRSDGEKIVNSGLMVALFPLFHLLGRVMSEGLQIAMFVVTGALLIVWRVNLSRRRRRQGGVAGV